MTFRFLTRKQIDAVRWDACVAASEQVLLYGFSWYLDAVAPGWAALVAEGANGYEAVWPLPVKQRPGWLQVYQPPFCQQLGFFARQPLSEATVLAAFAALPASVKSFYTQLNTSNTQLQPWLPGSYQLQKRLTHHLDLQQPYEQLWRGYRENHRRSVKKAQKQGYTVHTAVALEPLVALFRQEKGEEVPGLKERHYALLLRLFRLLQQRQVAEVREVRAGKELLCGLLVLRSPGKLIYLFGSATAAARKTGAMTLLFDELIREHATQPLLLDFEGSMIPGIAHFFQGFGALPVPYLSLSRNKLPWPLSRIFS